MEIKSNSVVSRSSEFKVIDPKTGVVLSTILPYGSVLCWNMERRLRRTMICNWDPYNAVIVSEIDGKIEYTSISKKDLLTVKSWMSKTGFQEIVMIETKDKRIKSYS